MSKTIKSRETERLEIIENLIDGYLKVMDDAIRNNMPELAQEMVEKIELCLDGINENEVKLTTELQ